MAIAFPILGAIGLSRDIEQIESLSNALTPFQSAILIAFYVGGPLFFRSVAFIIMPRLWPELKDASRREAHQAWGSFKLLRVIYEIPRHLKSGQICLLRALVKCKLNRIVDELEYPFREPMALESFLGVVVANASAF